MKRGTESTWELSAHSAHILCESKISLKNRVYFKGRRYIPIHIRYIQTKFFCRVIVFIIPVSHIKVKCQKTYVSRLKTFFLQTII